jgi:group I intron endonuclease
MIGIYKIISPSGKIYIGQSIDIKRRFSEYKYLSCKQQPKIYNSLKKYGFENHTFDIIEECTLEQLNEREVYYKILFNSVNEGLNCELHDNGTGPRPQEVKDKIGLYHKGNQYNLGKKRSEETKQKLSELAKSQSWRKEIGPKLKGKTRSEEFKQNKWKKIKDNNTGKIYNSCTEASKDLGISLTLISNSLNKIYKTSK